MTEKELYEEIRLARISALVSLGVSIINIIIIMTFSLMFLK